MKSTILKLKERVVVVEGDVFEIPEYTQMWLEDKIKLICKGSELSEEIAKGLSERTGERHPSYQGDWYIDYSDDDKMCDSALDSFISAIEANGFTWNSENPYKQKPYEGADDYEVWKEFESKNFHPEQCLIFKIV